MIEPAFDKDGNLLWVSLVMPLTDIEHDALARAVKRWNIMHTPPAPLLEPRCQDCGSRAPSVALVRDTTAIRRKVVCERCAETAGEPWRRA